MKSKKEVMSELSEISSYEYSSEIKLAIELLLDIRELLLEKKVKKEINEMIT